MNKKEMLKDLKRKLMIPTLVSALALTSGCSSSNNNEENDGFYVETPQMFEYFNHSNNRIDILFGLEETSKVYPLKIDYLLDTSFLSEEDYKRFKKAYGIPEDYTKPYGDFVHLVGERTLDSKVDIDDEILMPDDIIDRYNIIVWPEELENYPIPTNHLNSKIKVQKLKTMDYRTLYNIDSTINFTDDAKDFVPGLKKGDYMHCSGVYEVKDGKLKELYRHQTGAFSDSFNISSLNYNSTPILTKIDETIFQNLDGTYINSYISEALDTYLGADAYYSDANTDVNFDKFKKTSVLK